MRPIAKFILITAGILAGTALAATLALNLWLLMPGTAARIRTQLSAATGSVVSFRSIHALPTGTIRITGISATGVEASSEAVAEAITISPSFRDLLRGHLVIGSCSVERPVVRLKTSSPAPPSSAIANAPSPSTAPVTPSSDHIQSPHRSGQEPGHDADGGLVGPQTRFTVRHGEFVLSDASSRPVVKFTEVSLSEQGNLPVLHASTAQIGTSLIFRDLKASVVRNGDTILLRDIAATFGGGSVSGTVECDSPFSPGPQYRTELSLSGADLKKLLADASLPSDSASGSVSATLSLGGVAGQGSTMQGKGSLICRQVIVQPVDFLRQIGKILGVEELQLLRLPEARGLFTIEAGNLRIDDLLLRSDNLMLDARGPINGKGELDLQSRLLFNEKLSARLRGVLGQQLSAAPEPGYSQVSFHVTGPALQPRTDLLERLTGIRIDGDLGGLGNLLRGLFGKPSPPSAR